MDWNRDIFTFYPASYIKQEMDCPYVQGKIYKIPYPPDDISGSNFYQYDREHGKRYSVVRICICNYKNLDRKIHLPAGKKKYIFRILAGVIAAYGCHAFIKRQIGSYMFLKKHFVFFDYTEPLVFFMLDYIAVMGLFIARL